MTWADSYRRLGVRANADTPRCRPGPRLRRGGIGLCRTEHMFFDEERLLRVREMICADDEQARRAALAALLPMAARLRRALFETMAGLPVKIRLLDPPLRVPPPPGARGGGAGGGPEAAAREDQGAGGQLSEINPMLGFRGCRLAIRHPEIPQMQARAIFEAAVEAGRRTERAVAPEIMIPLIAYRAEFDILARIIRDVARTVEQETGTQVAYRIGTMVEAAALGAQGGRDRGGADGAEFFSFGTNDLTQTTIGLCATTPRRSSRLLGPGSVRDGPLRIDRPRGGRRARQDRRGSRARRQSRGSRSASAASTGATPPRWPSLRGGARPSSCSRSAFPSPGSPRRRRRSTAGRPPRAPCTPDRPRHAGAGPARGAR